MQQRYGQCQIPILPVKDFKESVRYYTQGVEIVKEIESKPWGVREFTFRDLNGHVVRRDS